MTPLMLAPRYRRPAVGHLIWHQNTILRNSSTVKKYYDAQVNRCVLGALAKKKEEKTVVFKGSSHAYSPPPLRLSNLPQVTSSLTPEIEGKTGTVGIPRHIMRSNPG